LSDIQQYTLYQHPPALVGILPTGVAYRSNGLIFQELGFNATALGGSVEVIGSVGATDLADWLNK